VLCWSNWTIVVEPTFIRDLTVVVVSAGMAAVVFRLLNLPVLLGYLLAGLLIGPHLFENPLIRDGNVIHELSELGVVFLMFYIGLEFDIGKLKKVLVPSMVAIVLQTVVMLSLGSMLGPLLGLGPVQALFLGGILAISSSMVTIQVLRETGMHKHSHAQLAVGILILEDVLAILLLVVLSGVAVTGKLAWLEVAKATALIGVFVVAVYIMGRILSAPLVRLLHRLDSLEMLTLITVAMALGVGLLAEQFHFSVALGALSLSYANR